LLAKLAANLLHVAINLLKVVLETLEHGVERLLIACEMRSHELFENVPVAVFRAPETRHLFKPAL
jgi:hypothetical protein